MVGIDLPVIERLGISNNTDHNTEYSFDKLILIIACDRPVLATHIVLKVCGIKDGNYMFVTGHHLVIF